MGSFIDKRTKERKVPLDTLLPPLECRLEAYLNHMVSFRILVTTAMQSLVRGIFKVSHDVLDTIPYSISQLVISVSEAEPSL